MDTTESHVEEFVNSEFSDFSANLAFTCTYETSTPPSFKLLPSEIMVNAGTAQTFEAEIIFGSLPLLSVDFTPDALIAPFISMTVPSDDSSAPIGHVTHNGDPSVINVLGLKPSFPMVFTLKNIHEQVAEYTVLFKISCPISKKELDSIKGLLASESLELVAQSERVGTDELSYKQVYDKVVEAVKFDDVKKKSCGDILVKLVTKKPQSLKHDATNKTLTLKAEDSTSAETFDDSYLEI